MAKPRQNKAKRSKEAEQLPAQPVAPAPRIYPDPNHPNMQRAARLVSEIIWRYVLTHTVEECMELQRRVEATRLMGERLFGTPRPQERTSEEPPS